MNNTQMLGVVLLVVGAILLYFGYQASQTVSEQIVETFTGRFTDSTTWYILGGAAASVAGFVMLMRRR